MRRILQSVRFISRALVAIVGLSLVSFNIALSVNAVVTGAYWVYSLLIFVYFVAFATLLGLAVWQRFGHTEERFGHNTKEMGGARVNLFGALLILNLFAFLCLIPTAAM